MPRPVTPLLAVDVIISIGKPGDPLRGVVLVKRRNAPKGWALPGGFVNVGERIRDAAAREALEETGLRIRDLQAFSMEDNPKRDPRGHTVSVVFTAEATGVPKGGDDAKEACIFSPESLPTPIAFDHLAILKEYFTDVRRIRA